MYERAVGLAGRIASTRKQLRLLPILLIALSLPSVPWQGAFAKGHRSHEASSLGQGTATPSTVEVTALQPGKPIERQMIGGQEHFYQISLNEGQYARIVVEQRGVDVDIQLLSGDGQIIAVFDGEYKSQGQEIVDIVAETAGNYRLNIRGYSTSNPAGQYQIRIDEVRAASEKDRALYAARVLIEQSTRALWAGSYKNFRQYAERALTITEKVDAEHPLIPTLMYSLALYYSYKEDFPRSITLSEQALVISLKILGEDDVRTIDLYRLLAWTYFQTNEVAKSERLAERALEVSQKAFGSEHPYVSQSLITLAQITRDPKKAEQLLQRSLMVAEKAVGSDHRWVGDALNELGVFYTNNGDYPQAERFMLRSQALNEKLYGPESLSHVVNLHNLGRIAREKKDYVKALEYYLRAIAIVEKAFGPENPRLAMILNNTANIYRARGEYAKSLEAHLQVLSISEKTRGPYHPFTLTSLGNIAKTYAAQGNIAEAIKFQSRVDAVIERNIEMNLAIGAERQKFLYLRAMSERTERTLSLNIELAPDDATASALAALVLLQRKGRLLDAMSENFASLRQRSTPDEQALLQHLNETNAQLARLVLNGPQSMSFEDHQRHVRELEEQKDKVEGDISRRSAEFRAASQPVTLAAVQAAIPAKAALIEFAVSRPFDPKAESNSEAYKEPRYVACIIRRQGAVRCRNLGDTKSIDETVSSMRQALGDPLKREVRELSRTLDEKVMQPIRAQLGDANQLLISPDGALNLIPFEALLNLQGRYLVQDYSVTYLTSGRDLLRLQVARDSKSNPLAIADPLFGEPVVNLPVKVAATTKPTDENSRRRSVTNARDLTEVYFAPLGGTAEEARSISKLFKDMNLLIGTQATESALKQVSAPRILHLATHGFFLQEALSAANSPAAPRGTGANARIDNPLLRSGLALAGANVRASSPDDGILTALEASGLNLWGTKLVVLSACDTGVGEVRNGEGVYGLRRAFALGGAESLVMSLWPISDYSTRTLMANYYKNLKAGSGRGESLRQVQLEMLKRNPRLHPFYWANFIQSGEWANLAGRR